MTKQTTRITGGLLLVVVSMLLASLACYSGQIPGVFELTPYYTETPLPPVEGARFQVGDTALTSQETQSLFNLTTYPEPLQRSLINSKSMCLPNTPARVLYAGQGGDGNVYYLVECGGSAGWAVDQRLAGPLEFTTGELALTVASEGKTQIQMLDKTTNFQPVMFPACTPGAVVSILGIEAVDVDGDGIKDVFYNVDCGAGAAYLTAENLAGPLELNKGDRALAIPAEGVTDNTYDLASEPAPVTSENAVEGECNVGSILTTEGIQLVGDTVYYQMACGEIEGWTTQDDFVGPLLYDAGDNVVIYMPAIPIYEDELPTADTGDEAASDETTGEEAVVEPTPVEDTTGDGTTTTGTEDRVVVQYTPPLELTDNPAPAVSDGDDANVVGQCPSGTAANIEDYTGADTVYYKITCETCAETTTDENGNEVCAQSVTNEGWAPQRYLQGPLAFMPGDHVMFKDAGDTDDEGNPVARIPLQPTYIVGANTQLAGRCPLDEGVDIVGLRTEKDRTRNAFSFYYQVQCQGDLATADGFNTGGADTVIGWASERSLEAPAE
ncbi:MAG TPA: hypothetical protein PKD09_04250 [Aggregatilinea sp.]|uniref:hypothetical protein n=1 Tax=Aggregatilinea sp. TaxID=2806333 RepID=UPI002B6494D4|nr:hypothetical protein [Aggregatilinea sp.]HML20834.1 hypothetical protein [Aggregatilinea sp.]